MAIKKRLAAMGAAVMMMASMAVINASAAYQNYTLSVSHPSVPVYFTTTRAGRYYVQLRVGTKSAGSTVTCDGYVYRNNVWNYIVSVSTSSTNTVENSGSWEQINSGLDARNTVSINPKNGNAEGATNGY